MATFDFSTFPILQTERLHLRQIMTTDATAWLAVLSDEQVIRYLSDVDEPFISTEQVMPLIGWADHIFAGKSGIRWAITPHNESTLIGTCGFHKLDIANFKAEIGYELGSSHWRQGIMTEALTAVLDFCFSKLNLHRVAADVTDGNEASAGILRSFGFVHEGAWREAVFTKGQFQDLWQFGLLARDYFHTRIK